MTLLSYNDAVVITHKLVAYLNNPDSDGIIEQMGTVFNLKYRNGFYLHVSSIQRNCPECTGCHKNMCTLGCYIDGEDKVCYWDKALDSILGTKLIVHEIGHLVYRQAFISDLPPEQDFQQSEQFAQYFETHFDINPQFLPQNDNYSIHSETIPVISLGKAVVVVVAIGFGMWILNQISKKQNTRVIRH
jgi:hypothetical protein